MILINRGQIADSNYLLKDKLTMVIQTCDKFSDLWEGHFKLLNKNWADRQIDTLLVTDEATANEIIEKLDDRFSY